MEDYISIGSSPADVEGRQVGRNTPDELRQEAEIFKKQLLRMYPKARLSVKKFPHDFGSYYEVVVWYNDQNKEETDLAFKIEGDTPTQWDAEALREINASSISSIKRLSARHVVAYFIFKLQPGTAFIRDNHILTSEEIRAILNEKLGNILEDARLVSDELRLTYNTNPSTWEYITPNEKSKLQGETDQQMLMDYLTDAGVEIRPITDELRLQTEQHTTKNKETEVARRKKIQELSNQIELASDNMTLEQLKKQIEDLRQSGEDQASKPLFNAWERKQKFLAEMSRIMSSSEITADVAFMIGAATKARLLRTPKTLRSEGVWGESAMALFPSTNTSAKARIANAFNTLAFEKLSAQGKPKVSVTRDGILVNSLVLVTFLERLGLPIHIATSEEQELGLTMSTFREHEPVLGPGDVQAAEDTFDKYLESREYSEDERLELLMEFGKGAASMTATGRLSQRHTLTRLSWRQK